MTRGAAVLLLLLTVSCSGPESRADGVVVTVSGGLDGVAGFEIVTSAGERLVFLPDPALTRFEGGAPLSHLHEHLQTGVPVRVTYETRDGMLVATAVSDAP